MTEEEEDREMRAYLEKWTEGYMVDGVDIDLKEGSEVQTLAGEQSKLTFVAHNEGGEQDWQKVRVHPGGATILAVKEVRNYDLQKCLYT